MHSAFHRANNIFFYGLTVLLCLALASAQRHAPSRHEFRHLALSAPLALWRCRASTECCSVCTRCAL